MKKLLISNRSTGRARKLDEVKTLEPRLTTPFAEIGSRVVKGIAEFDKHVERHQQAKGIFSSGIINQILNDDEGSAFRKRIKCLP